MPDDVGRKMIGASPEDGTAIGRVLGKLASLTHTGTGWMARCPAHDDRQNSLSVGVGEDGRVLLHCFAGCDTEAIVEKLGLTMRDLFEKHSETEGGGAPILPNASATVQPSQQGGLTLAEYASAKQLPLDFLHSLGLSQIRQAGPPYLRIPYMDAHGGEIAVRYRLALHGDSRFRWKPGTKACLYGLQRLREAKAAGHVVLVEGESDAQTLWLHAIPALGIPGASNWKEEWAAHLEGISTIHLVLEPDTGREAIEKWLASSAIRDRVRLVDLGEAEDTSALYLENPDAFASRFRAALEASVPWVQFAEAEADARAQEAWAVCKDLAQQPRILDRLVGEMAAAGVAGESRVVRLLYLALTSRLLDKPVSIAVKGPSSAGKSFLVQRALDFFPNSAYYALTAMSEHALAYSEEPLSHRFVVMFEAAGLQTDFASYLMRSLLTEGRMVYETVEKVSGKLRGRRIEREGPTGLVVTTTQVHLDSEDETRVLSVQVTDTPEQTRAVMVAIAEDDRQAPDYTVWHALQEWLESQEPQVTIPFARALAEMIPPFAVRLRRDFGFIRSLIRAHAWLHRENRERDAHRRVVAALDDYEVVRELVSDLVSEAVEATVSDTVRETVEAVRKLNTGLGSRVTVTQVATELGIGTSSASRRVSAAIDGGYLRNEEARRGCPAWLVVGDPLPDRTEVLPSPERLRGCTVASDSRGHTPLSPHRPATDGGAARSGNDASRDANRISWAELAGLGDDNGTTDDADDAHDASPEPFLGHP